MHLLDKYAKNYAVVHSFLPRFYFEMCDFESCSSISTARLHSSSLQNGLDHFSSGRAALSKSLPLLEMVAPILIKEARLAYRNAEMQTSKDIIGKVWESIKMVDNPSDLKILNSGKKEKLAYSLFTSEEGFGLVSDFLDWLNDASALKAYKEYKEVTKDKYYESFFDSTPTRKKDVVRSRRYLVNYIATYGGDELRLDLLNTIDRLKAYELLYLEDETKSKTRYNFNPIASKNNHNKNLYSIIAASGGEEAILKFLDVIGKMENGGELLLAKPQDDYYYSRYHFDGLVSLIAAKMDFEYKFNAEINGEISPLSSISFSTSARPLGLIGDSLSRSWLYLEGP